MRVCGGGGCARGHAGRGLLVGAPPQPEAALDPPLDAQRAELERVLAATTIVIFVFSLSYVVLSTIFGCFCSRQQQPGGGGGGETERPAAAVAEETKRALQEIPVLLVQVTRDAAGSAGGGAGAGAGAAEDGDEPQPGECAVCLAEYAGGEEVRVLPACGHGFHRDCVDRWLLTRAPTCPICRATVAAHAEGLDAKV